MFSGVFFFTYILAGFAGILAVLMIVMMTKYRGDGNKKLLAETRNFVLCTAAIDAMYFFIEYQKLKNDYYSSGAFTRVADILLFIGQIYFWTEYIREKSRLKAPKKEKLHNGTLFICIVCALMAVISYGFLMEDYYLVPAGRERNISVAIEIVLIIFLFIINTVHLIKALSEIVQKTIRRLTVGITVAIMINSLWNAGLVIALMTGQLHQSQESSINPTAVFLLLINAFAIMLVYQEDFSAMFTEPGQGSGENILQRRFDHIAQLHGLTNREREVMELVYEGMTNPEIADKLTISRNTVKKHVHNVFEKLDVSTRLEMVHLINGEIC